MGDALKFKDDEGNVGEGQTLTDLAENTKTMKKLIRLGKLALYISAGLAILYLLFLIFMIVYMAYYDMPTNWAYIIGGGCG